MLNEIEDTEDCNGGANEDGILDLNALFIDEKFKYKMNKDYAKLKRNPYILPYMRDCLTELRGLYILPLEKFYLKNRESLQEDYQYLLHHDLTEYLYKAIDDRDASQVGTNVDFNTACTMDIEIFLNRLKYLGVINSEEIETFKHVASDYYYYE